VSFTTTSVANTAQEAKRVVVAFFCDSATAVGDLVYVSPTDNNFVITAIDNVTVQPVIGVVYAKSQPTVCGVLLLGIKTGYTSLTKGAKVFLSTTGTVTQTLPAAGYHHILGVAVSETEILYSMNSVRTKRL
jgi:hypothetical protein